MATARSAGLWTIALLVVLPGCKAATSPTGPTPHVPSPVTTAPAEILMIAGPAVVPTGAKVKYDGTATLVIGVTIYHVAGEWNVDDPRVATIDSSGTLTGHRPGIVTIALAYRGKTATTTVRVSDYGAKLSAVTANLVMSFRPDPVTGSLTDCMGAVPSWHFAIVFHETHGVGFSIKAEVSNWYDESGQLSRTRTAIGHEHYLPANSELVEETCTDLEADLWESPSGFFEAVLHGVDDKGNELTFRKRVRLLPVSSTSAP